MKLIQLVGLKKIEISLLLSNKKIKMFITNRKNCWAINIDTTILFDYVTLFADNSD